MTCAVRLATDGHGQTGRLWQMATTANELTS